MFILGIMRYHYYNPSFSDEEDESSRLRQLSEFLQHYKLSQYLDAFISEGFDRLLSVSSKYFYNYAVLFLI